MSYFPNLLMRRLYSGVSKKVRAQKYVLTKYFQGEPKKSDFKIIEEELPELKDGGKYEFELSTYVSWQASWTFE